LISGGGDPPYDEAAVRARLRLLIEASLLPKIFSGEASAGLIWAEECIAACP
jgi:hypothetical protein